MKRYLVLAALLLPFLAGAQEKIDSIVVSAFRASEKTPVAHTEISREELRGASSSASLPMALALQPSAVVTNEGGTGLGYSKMRVRGSDATRINVTLNGITLNDAESQTVFWVNIPAIGSMLESVQLQRGVGTSVNGPGAFGASINMQTLVPSGEPYGHIEASAGSWMTGTLLLAGGTGRTPKGFSADARASLNTTEGWIDNAFARVGSAFLTAGWMDERNSVKINYLMGRQKSGITWLGCPAGSVAENPRFNPAYPGDSDNFQQHHIQSLYIRRIAPELYWSTTLNFTAGAGYYENRTESDGLWFDRRRATESGYYVASTSLKWSRGGSQVTGNLSFSAYDGEQYGYDVYADNKQDEPWYLNNALKCDAGGFIRGEHTVGPVSLYGDLQLRLIRHDISGVNEDSFPMDQRLRYCFFNPKGGVTVSLPGGNSLYASVAVSHKEPSRTDFEQAMISHQAEGMLPERMVDVESGWRLAREKVSLCAGIYLMEYRDQLLETGRISNVGYTIKENVPRSYRRGLELSAGWEPMEWLRLDGNLALSRNRILDYTLMVDRLDAGGNYLGKVSEHYGSTDILMSPSAVGMAAATFRPLPALVLGLTWKYVGRQFIDNTSSLERSLPAYDVFSLKAEYALRKVKITIFVDNLLSKRYVADAWVYRCFTPDGERTESGLFPQAPCNALLKLTFEL